MIVTVHIEALGNHEDVDLELSDDATEDEIRESAETVFYNNCNYGFSVNGEPQ